MLLIAQPHQEERAVSSMCAGMAQECRQDGS